MDPDLELHGDIDAPPDAVWSVVSDVTRIPEWSPVCRRCEWVEEGTRFRGDNKLNGVRWSRECVVTSSEPGREFGFATLFKGQESTRWRYRLEPLDGGGTRVHEAYEVVLVPPWLRLVRRLPGVVAKSERDTRWNIETSLGRLRDVVMRASPPAS